MTHQQQVDQQQQQLHNDQNNDDDSDFIDDQNQNQNQMQQQQHQQQPSSNQNTDSNNRNEGDGLMIRSTVSVSDCSNSSSSSSSSINICTLNSLRTNQIRMTILQYIMTYPQYSVVLFIYLSSMTIQMSIFNTNTNTNTNNSNTHRIWEPVQHINSIIQTESTLYEQCVIQSEVLSIQNQNSAVQKELYRIEQVRQQLYIPIRDIMIHNTYDCIDTTNTIIRSLQTWYISLGNVIPEYGIIYNNTDNATQNTTIIPTDIDICTYQDHEQLIQIIRNHNGNDIQSVQSAIQDAIQMYIDSSIQSINTLIQYSHDRSMYDYNYFIGIKVQSTIQLLDQWTFMIGSKDFISLLSSNITFHHPSIVVLIQKIRNVLQDILDALHGAHLQIDILTQQLIDFQLSIQLLYMNYNILYNRFINIQNFVIDFLPPNVQLPDYFDISTIPLPNTLLPSFDYNTIPNFHLHLPNITILANTFVNDALLLIINVIQELVQDVTDQSQRTIQHLIEAIRQIIQLDDYNPPKYPTKDNNNNNNNVTIPQDESNYVSNMAQIVQLDITKSFDTLYQNEQSFNETFNNDTTIPVNVNNMTLDDTINSNNNHTETISKLNIEYPEIHYPIWIISLIGFIISNSYYIEAIIQAYRLYKLKCRYETNATPDLPIMMDRQSVVVDSTSTRNDNSNTESTLQNKLNVIRFVLLKHIMNPWLIIGIVLIPCIIILFTLWFPHIKGSCIDSRHGTYLARHIFYPININRANSRGYALHNLQQIQCYNRQRYICNTQMMLSDSVLRPDVVTMHTLQSRYNESMIARDVISRCVDTTVLDELFYLHCCGLEGYNSTDTCHKEQQIWTMCPIDKQIDPPTSFRPIGEELIQPSCNVFPTIDEYIDDVYFNCSSIEHTCSNVPCSGVDEQFILLMTIEADCTIEIYIIQFCIFLAVVVYHAIMITIMNKLLYNGLLQIQWQQLKPDGSITCITSIDIHGQFLTGTTNIEERTELVQHMMQQYVRTGYIQIILGGILFMIWFISLFLIRYGTSHIRMYVG